MNANQSMEMPMLGDTAVKCLTSWLLLLYVWLLFLIITAESLWWDCFSRHQSALKKCHLNQFSLKHCIWNLSSNDPQPCFLCLFTYPSSCPLFCWLLPLGALWLHNFAQCCVIVFLLFSLKILFLAPSFLTFCTFAPLFLPGPHLSVFLHAIPFP